MESWGIIPTPSASSYKCVVNPFVTQNKFFYKEIHHPLGYEIDFPIPFYSCWKSFKFPSFVILFYFGKFDYGKILMNVSEKLFPFSLTSPFLFIRKPEYQWPDVMNTFGLNTKMYLGKAKATWSYLIYYWLNLSNALTYLGIN